MTARFFLVGFLLLLISSPALAQEPVMVATLGQAFMGPFQGADTFTTVTVTNRDPLQQSCDVDVLFSLGTEPGPPVAFNGQTTQNNFVNVNIPRGGARSFILTAEQLTQGIVNIFTFTPCEQNSISVRGSYTVPTPNGAIMEAFSITPNGPQHWLDDDQCLAFTAFLGRDNGGFFRDVGLANATARPGQQAPEGTQLNFQGYDQDGNLIGARITVPVDGRHMAFFPFTDSGLSGLITTVMCLDIPGTGSDFLLDTTLVGTAERNGFQFEAEIFADGFESGDLAAWTSSNP